MPLFPLPVEQFGPLNLVGAPDEVGFSGALDMLNVELDRPGQLRSRDGYAKFTSAAGINRYLALAAFYKTDGTRQLVAANSNQIDALNTSGAIVASQLAALGGQGFVSMARFAAPGSEHMYVAATTHSTTTVYRWDGTAWSTPAWTGTTPTGFLLSVYPSDSGGRLVNARYSGSAAGNNPSTVRFSSISSGPPPAPVPTTWNANDYVDIAPGDGEEITGLVAWQNLLFAFKESKFFAFYGTSTDSTGNPIFNNRQIVGQGMVPASGLGAYRGCVASPQGVFFLNRRGIWLTTGAAPQLISGPIDPIFRSGTTSFWNGGVLNQAQISLASLTWHDNRLFFSYPSGSNTFNDSTIVYDPQAQTWVYWNLPIAHAVSFRVSSAEELLFAYATATNDIGRHNRTSSFIQDGGDGLTTGAAITWRYQSGYDNIAPPRRFSAHYLFGNTRKRITKWKLTGTGTVTFGVAHDFGAVGTTSSLALGTSPAIADAWHQRAGRGQLFSYRLSGTSPASIQKMTAYLAGSEPPLLGNVSDQ